MALKNNEEKFPIFFDTIEFSHGLMPRSLDQIISLDRQIKQFQALKSAGIFVMFVGVLNHWVTFLVYKKALKDLLPHEFERFEKGHKMVYKFFLLDSANLVHLSKNEVELPELIMDRVR